MPAKRFPAALVDMRNEFFSDDENKPAWVGAHEDVLRAIFGAMQAWSESGPGDCFYDLRDIACDEMWRTQRSRTERSDEVRLCCALFDQWLDY
jgi:hypothetical protein